MERNSPSFRVLACEIRRRGETFRATRSFSPAGEPESSVREPPYAARCFRSDDSGSARTVGDVAGALQVESYDTTPLDGFPTRCHRSPSVPHESERLYAHACRVIPGGVNSPVRSWTAVGEHPLFLQRGRAAEVVDADGRAYLDFLGSWGALLRGPAPPRVIGCVAH